MLNIQNTIIELSIELFLLSIWVRCSISSHAFVTTASVQSFVILDANSA